MNVLVEINIGDEATKSGAEELKWLRPERKTDRAAA